MFRTVRGLNGRPSSSACSTAHGEFAFDDVVIIAIQLEHLPEVARLSDQAATAPSAVGVERDSCVAEIHNACAVLKDVPAIVIQTVAHIRGDPNAGRPEHNAR